MPPKQQESIKKVVAMTSGEKASAKKAKVRASLARANPSRPTTPRRVRLRALEQRGAAPRPTSCACKAP